MERPSWHDYFMRIADLARSRATCPRRQVGAVLTRDDRIIATGYNGSVPGDEHCDEVGCLIVDEHCVRTVHAELNALLQCAASSQTSEGATLYSTDFPCLHCAKSLIQAKVRRIFYRTDYPDPHSGPLFRRAGVELVRMRWDGSQYLVEPEG